MVFFLYVRMKEKKMKKEEKILATMTTISRLEPIVRKKQEPILEPEYRQLCKEREIRERGIGQK